MFNTIREPSGAILTQQNRKKIESRDILSIGSFVPLHWDDNHHERLTHRGLHSVLFRCHFLSHVLGTVGQFKTKRLPATCGPGSISNAIRNNANVFYIFRSVLYQKSVGSCYKDKGTVKLNNFNIFVLNYKLEIFELLSCKGKISWIYV